MKETYYLPASKLKLREREDGSLLMHLDGQSVELAQPKRALPLSNPDEFIILYDLDGNELGILHDLTELDSKSRDALQEALKKAYRIETITRILEVERDTLTGQVRWRVEIAVESSREQYSEERLADTIKPSDAQNGQAEDTTGPLRAATKSSVTGEVPAAQIDGMPPAGPSNEQDGQSHNGNGASHSEEKLLSKVRLFRPRDKERRKDKEQPDDDSEIMSGEEREFMINGQEDVQTARYPHIYIVDTDRNRYEILDCEALDLASRQAAERYF
ncbi:MAG: DUF1854 domain-containing protein [Abitibacteriaceae bacterium]|nr:DUF1854 domain-containing protein [Abditibacteriaceae bacterium]